MFYNNRLPKSSLAIILRSLQPVLSAYSIVLFSVCVAQLSAASKASADIIIGGFLVDDWENSASFQGGNSASDLARVGNLQNVVTGAAGGSTVNSLTSLAWAVSGNVTSLSINHNASFFRPNGGPGLGSLLRSGFDVYAPAGTVVKLEYFGGQVSTVNAEFNFHFGTGLDPWSYTETIGANPNFRITFEGRDYFLMLNGGAGLASIHRARGGILTPGTGSYTGNFEWRVTNLSAVPEPASLMLVGIVGLTALGARRRFGFLRSSASDSGSTPIEQAAK